MARSTAVSRRLRSTQDTRLPVGHTHPPRGRVLHIKSTEGLDLTPTTAIGTAPLSQAPERPDLTIDWAIPAQPPGARGAIARFFGPGLTPADAAVQVIGVLVCTGLLAWHLALTLPAMSPGLEWYRVTLLAVVGVDLIGGVLTNATGAAKRWYHRPGSRRSRLAFVTGHTVYLSTIALLVLPLNWAWLGVNAVVLLVAALVIEVVPLTIRRPVAAGWVLVAILLNLVLVPLPTALVWFVPMFYLKLLVFHQTPEAPLAETPYPTGAA
jgi:hypothetical protein